MKAIFQIIRKYHFVSVFLLLSFIVINPFQKGYFFLLDYVAYPITDFNWFSVFSSSIGWFLFNTLIPFAFTAALAQKITLFSIIFLLGLGGYQLGRRYGTIPAYFSGFFAFLNPFVYSRLIEGQISPVLSLVLLLWGFVYFRQYHESFTLKPLLFASLLFGFSINLMVHSIFMVILILAVFFVVYFPPKKYLGSYFLKTLIGVAIILTLNLIGVINQLLPGKEPIHFINQVINTNDFLAFLSESGGISIHFNTLSLHGYWGEGEGRFLPSVFFIDHWQIVFFAIFFFVILGIFYGIRRKETRKNSIVFLILGIITYILSIGIASPHFGFITEWLYTHLPFYKGFREPQKWTAVLLIVYLVFSAMGIQAFFKWKFIRLSRAFWAGIILALPIFYTSTMFFRFMGQLKTYDYPPDWYQLYDELPSLMGPNKGALECSGKTQGLIKECYQVLVFPWHQYMSFRFTGKNMTNPIKGFFNPVPILQGDNMEIGNIYSQSNRPESKIIEKYVGLGQNREPMATPHFPQNLTDLGISYILVAKEVDWEGYDFYLKQNPALSLIWESENFILYQIDPDHA